MTNLEAKQALARKLNIDYSTIADNDRFSDSDLQDWIQIGVFQSWDFKPWPFTGTTKTLTTVSTDYYDWPSDAMLGSAIKLSVGGKEFRELRFEDYLKYFEDNPTGTDRIWAPHENFIFVNKYAYSVGAALDIVCKKMAPALSGSSDLLPFSPATDNQEHSGNAAIIDLAHAQALDSEKLNNPQKAAIVRQQAYAMLSILWKPFADSKALQQSKARPMFDAPDYFRTGSGPSQNGRFNY